jgi:hypothetical protein
MNAFIEPLTMTQILPEGNPQVTQYAGEPATPLRGTLSNWLSRPSMAECRCWLYEEAHILAGRNVVRLRSLLWLGHTPVETGYRGCASSRGQADVRA